MTRYLFVLLLALTLAACASVPKPLRGDFAEGLDVAAVQSQPEAFIGRKLRWGGVILAVENLRDESRLEILAYPLDSSARPSIGEAVQGRFLLRSEKFLDPAVYLRDREVTVVGILRGVETKSIGNFDYRYPVIEGHVLYLWPEREVPRPYYYDPWDPWYGYPYPWYRPYNPRP